MRIVAGDHLSRNSLVLFRKYINLSIFAGGLRASYFSAEASPSQLTAILLTTCNLSISSKLSQYTFCPFVDISTIEAFHFCLGISATILSSCRCSNGSPKLYKRKV